MIATCGQVTVAEVEQLVDVGELDPDQIHTPGIFVDRIIQGAKYEKRIEFRTVSGAAASGYTFFIEAPLEWPAECGSASASARR